MNYKRFIIKNYKAIEGPLEVDISKKSLIPIIGVNECGKTTILQAIFAFDQANDVFDPSVHHLTDVHNLYSYEQKSPTITAEIGITWDEFRQIIKKLEKTAQPPAKTKLSTYLKKKSQFTETIQITRDLITKKYSLHTVKFKSKPANELLSPELISLLPNILYFDDFRGKFEEQIEISKSSQSSTWLPIFETLFRTTIPNTSIYELPKMEERQRKTILSKVNKALNTTLTEEWRNFQLDETKTSLRISLDYFEETPPSPDDTPKPSRHYLKTEVVETDGQGNEHFFYVTDRSKGFFWFFNFVMKLEFNPKAARSSDFGAIYLLDEPGSYLHAAAQSRLCLKLKNISERNKVVYCTHTHYLLNPEVIPINNIQISEKTPEGRIHLIPFHEHKGNITVKFSAYQPLADALQVRYIPFELTDRPVIIVEGMIDRLLLDMFRSNDHLNVFPSVGAPAMKFAISLMIAWKLQYLALWDNDDAGRYEYKKATDFFGQFEADAHFRLLPFPSPRYKNRIIQDLVDGSDVRIMKEALQIPSNSSFDKTITTLYYSAERATILESLTGKTKQNFSELSEFIGDRLNSKFDSAK